MTVTHMPPRLGDTFTRRSAHGRTPFGIEVVTVFSRSYTGSANDDYPSRARM